MKNPTCAICDGPLENAHLCDPAHAWICTACDTDQAAQDAPEEAISQRAADWLESGDDLRPVDAASY